MRDVRSPAFVSSEVSERGEVPAAGAVHIVVDTLRSVSLLEGLYDKLRRMHTSLERRVYPVICTGMSEGHGCHGQLTVPPVNELGLLATVRAGLRRGVQVGTFNTDVVEVGFEESGEALLLVAADHPRVHFVSELISEARELDQARPLIGGRLQTRVSGQSLCGKMTVHSPKGQVGSARGW